MDSGQEQPVRLRVSPLAYLAGIAVGVVLVAVLGVLIAVLVVLEDSRTHIQAQDHKIATLQGDTEPVLKEAKPLLEDAGPALRRAEPFIVRAQRLLAPAGESLESLTTASDAVPRLVAGTDLLLSESIPLIQALTATDAPGAILSVGRLADSLSEGDRAVRLIDAAGAVLVTLDRTNLVPRAAEALPRFQSIILELVRVQKKTLRYQKLSLRTQRRQANLTFESIRIQREILEHTRSIDRKIPPPATTATPAPAAPAAP